MQRESTITSIALSINGQERVLDVQPHETLAEVLRDAWT